MKPKKIEKKLFLNKKTIAHLNNGQLREVKGGDTTVTLDTCQTYCSCTCETCVWTITGCYCPTGHRKCDTYICVVTETCPEICY